MRRAGLVAAITLCLGACASPTQPWEGYARDRLTREDISAILALDAYGAIRRLRPRWLSGLSVIYENGVRVDQGGIIFLRTLRIENVVEIRYIEPDVARTIYGYNIRGGVIEIDTAGR